MQEPAHVTVSTPGFWHSLNSRKGTIHISGALLKSVGSNPALTSKIVSALCLMPYRAEFLFQQDVLEISGTSPYFDRLTPGYVIPHYQIQITAMEDAETHEGYSVRVLQQEQAPCAEPPTWLWT